MEYDKTVIKQFCEVSPGAVAVYRIDADSISMLDFSDELPHMLGFTHDEYVQRGAADITELVVPRDRAALQKSIERAIVEQAPVDASYRAIIGTGAYHWMNVRGRCIGEQDGCPIVIAEFLDTTQETQLHACLLDTASSGIHVFDTQTYEVLYANQRALDLWNKQGEDYFGRTCYEFFRNRSEPCSWCGHRQTGGNDKWDTGEDPDSGNYLHISSSAIDWFGRHACYVTIEDLTEEHRAKQSTDQVVDAIANLPVISMLVQFFPGKTAKPVSFSDEYCAMMGVTQQRAWELYGENALLSVHPDDQEMLADFALAHIVAKDDALQTIMHRFVRPDGKIIWVVVNFAFFKVEDKQYGYMVYTDITSVKMEEDEFRRRYVESQAYIDSVSDAYVDAVRVNLTQNRIEAISGTSPLAQLDFGAIGYDELMLGRIEDELPRQVDRDALEQRFLREPLLAAYEAGERVRTVEGQVRVYSTSEPIWARATMNLMRNPDTQDVLSFVTVEDIDDEVIDRQVFERMISSDECDFIAIIDVGKRTIEFRRVADESPTVPDMSFTDYDKTQASNAERYVEEAQRQRVLRETSIETIVDRLQHEETYTCAITFAGQGGSLRRKLLRYSYLNRATGKVLAVRTDITETYLRERAYTDQLQAALESAEQANEAKSDFLSRMSHDIRTPMNGIIGMARIAREQDNPARTRDCLDKIETSSSFLLGLVNDILDMSKAESGKMELHPEPYLMASFNDYIDSVFKPLYEEKNQTFEVELHPVRSVVPIIDVLRFNQIIFNLLSNAVKYTPEGGTIKLNVWNELVEGHREQIIVKVVDNGVGMSEEFQKVLFDPFSQETHSDETSEGNGTGLGLSIVKKLVDLMGGRIEVQSTLGKGSTFTVAIDFDYIDADQATWGQHEAAGPVDVDALAGKHVLVCEDHPLNQEIALHLLRGDGLNVTLAEDGKKGVQLFEVSPPKYYDAVLMDVRMPVMDGLQATRAIRALDRADAASVPIIAMTADAYADDVRKCIDAGMNAHVPKPIDPEVLTATLAKWCMRS